VAVEYRKRNRSEMERRGGGARFRGISACDSWRQDIDRGECDRIVQGLRAIKQVASRSNLRAPRGKKTLATTDPERN